MAPEPISHLPSSQQAVHHFRSLPADLHSKKYGGTPPSKIQLTSIPSLNRVTPAQQRAILLSRASPAIHRHTRSPSISSSARRRASRHHKLLFYPLLIILELLILALPITIIFLAQAAAANRTFVSPLIAFFLIAFCTCLVAAGVGVLFTQRRRSQLIRKRKLQREVQRWRTLARERGREIEVLRAVSERLRSSSRGRRKRDESMSRAGSESCGMRSAREEDGRSVSRGRTGRGAVTRDLDVEDGIAELEGLEIRMVRAVPEVVKTIVKTKPNTKGNFGRAKEAAFARIRGEVVEKPLPRMPSSSPPPPQPPPGARQSPSPAHQPLQPPTHQPPLPDHQQPSPAQQPRTLVQQPVSPADQSLSLPPQTPSPAHPPRRASLGWLPRYNNMKAKHFGPQSPRAAHLRHPSYELDAISPLSPRSESQTLTLSPLQALPHNLQKTVLLPPPELVLDRLDSPPAQMTVLDRYVVPEQYRQTMKRLRESEERWVLPRSPDRERRIRQRQELEAQTARDDAESAGASISTAGDAESRLESQREWDRVRETVFNTESSDDVDEDDDEEEIGVAQIARGGNGGRGDAQSDDNFKESHALAEDATSLTESLRREKRAESLKKVASWEDGTRVPPAEVEEEAAGVEPGSEDYIPRTAGPQAGDASWRDGLGIGRPSERMKDADWEIHQRRRNFAMFVETKKLQSKNSSGSVRGKRTGVGRPAEKRTV